MTAPKLNTQYDNPGSNAVINDEPSMTKQEFREETDVNNIIGQYNAYENVSGDRQPIYGDFTDLTVTNYQHALNTLASADEVFMQLPARVRERFANDPVNMLLFVQDPANQAEAKELGLLEPEPAAPPPPAPTPETTK